MNSSQAAMLRRLEAAECLQFVNRLRILRSIDHFEVPEIEGWRRFREDPYEYLIQSSREDTERIWRALRKREAK